MNELVFPSPMYDELASKMRDEPRESAAFALASVVSRADGTQRLLVHEVRLAEPGDYNIRTAYSLQLTPEFFGAGITASRVEDRALVLIHSHPAEEGVPRFSPVDDEGERVMAPYVIRRAAKRPHATLVIGREGCAARQFPDGEPLSVSQIGRSRTELFTPGREAPPLLPRYDRQVRAFGAQGQAKMSALTVAIIGLGGTGSVVAQQLSHLGVQRFLLVDPDVVDETNLNRTVGATPAAAGMAKTAVAAAAIGATRPDAVVHSLVGDVTSETVARRVSSVDFIFSCTDTQGSRALLGQIAYQYLIPMIDVGVNIVVEDGRIRFMEGRAQMFSPGLGCAVCGQQLDWHAVRSDLQTEHHRSHDPYFTGRGEPQPAVISLNSVVASLGVTMFLAAVAGVPSMARYQMYDAMSGRVRTLAQAPEPACVVCSTEGALARGDEWPLPVRAT